MSTFVTLSENSNREELYALFHSGKASGVIFGDPLVRTRASPKPVDSNNTPAAPAKNFVSDNVVETTGEPIVLPEKSQEQPSVAGTVIFGILLGLVVLFLFARCVKRRTRKVRKIRLKSFEDSVPTEVLFDIEEQKKEKPITDVSQFLPNRLVKKNSSKEDSEDNNALLPRYYPELEKMASSD